MKWIKESKRCQMKKMRSLVGVEIWRTRRDAAYAVMRTQRVAKRERMVVRSITRVEGAEWVSISANGCVAGHLP